MDNALQFFKNEEFGKIRTINKDNVIWFVGKDVANILGYRETANMRKILERAEYIEINPQSQQYQENSVLKVKQKQSILPKK